MSRPSTPPRSTNAVVGEVLNDTFDFHAFLQVFQQLIAFCAVSDSITARRGDTTTLLRFWSSLMTLNSSSLPSGAGVANRTNVNQGTRQERAGNTIQLNSEATFNFAVDNTDYSFQLLRRKAFFQRDPSFVTFSFHGTAGFHRSRLLLHPEQRQLRHRPGFPARHRRFELLCRNGRLRFQTSVNQYDIFVDSNNNTTNDGTRTGFDCLRILQIVEQKIQSCFNLQVSYLTSTRLRAGWGCFNIPAVHCCGGTA